jgi:hypothetical protein
MRITSLKTKRSCPKSNVAARGHSPAITRLIAGEKPWLSMLTNICTQFESNSMIGVPRIGGSF